MCLNNNDIPCFFLLISNVIPFRGAKYFDAWCKINIPKRIYQMCRSGCFCRIRIPFFFRLVSSGSEYHLCKGSDLDQKSRRFEYSKFSLFFLGPKLDANFLFFSICPFFCVYVCMSDWWYVFLFVWSWFCLFVPLLCQLPHSYRQFFVLFY